MKAQQLDSTHAHTDKQNATDEVFSQQQGVKVFLGLLKLTLALAVLIMIGLVISYACSNLESVERLITTTKPWLLSWRMLMFLILIAGWPKWSVMYAQWAGMNKAQLDRMLAYRWRIVIWLLVMEAVLSQDILSEFANNLITKDTTR